MKISFDFDGCLGDNKFVQLICKVFQSAGHDVFILTSRDPQMKNLDVWKLADDFDILKENVIMTNGTMKVHKFLELGIDIHFDNSFDEIVAINDLFTGDSPIKKSDNLPGILTNFDTEEMSYIYNFINNR
jgi:acid phosphatase class B